MNGLNTDSLNTDSLSADSPNEASSGAGSNVTAAPSPAKRASSPSHWSGVLLVIIIGGLAYLTTFLNSALDALALALIYSILIRAILRQFASSMLLSDNASERLQPGIQRGLQIFLPIGIVLYGFNLDLQHLSMLPWTATLLTIIAIGLFYLLIFWGYMFFNRSANKENSQGRIPQKLIELITAGSAICGANAIAILSPTIDADSEDTSSSILVVTAVGLLGLMSLPIIKNIFGFNDTVYAIISGTTIHQVSLVRTIAATLPAESAALVLAIKSLRILMLIPIIIFASLLHPRSQQAGFGQNLRRLWFLLPYIALGIMDIIIPTLSKDIGQQITILFSAIKPFGDLAFAIALAAIGLSVEIQDIVRLGARPLWLGIFGWLGVLAILLIATPLLAGIAP